MFKNILVIGLLALVLASFGCAQTQGFLGKYIPTVEAKIGASGIAIEIDPKFGINSLCLDPVGVIANFIGAIPIIGAATNDFVGLCDEVEVVE